MFLPRAVINETKRNHRHLHLQMLKIFLSFIAFSRFVFADSSVREDERQGGVTQFSFVTVSCHILY